MAPASLPAESSIAARIGLWLGPLAALLILFLLPDTYTDSEGASQALLPAARWAGALAAWMAIWWVTEALPVYVTALLPLAVLPASGSAPIRAVAAPYGHELIFLFLGGFVLALAIERWGLHRRIALLVLRAVPPRPRAIVGGFMVVAATMSMWVMNTSTTLMLLPVAVSVIRLLEQDRADEAAANSQFGVCLLLCLAYAASIGGIGTIVGTAPNLFVVSFLNERMTQEISFALWMAFGVPLVMLMLPLVWLVMTRLIYPLSAEVIPGARNLFESESADLPRLAGAERRVLWVFLATAGAWILRPWLSPVQIAGIAPFAGLTDAGIAVICAITLFLLPTGEKSGERLMNWDTAVKLPWGLLLLFGGGLSLAAALDQSGFSAFLGAMTTSFAGVSAFWLLVAVVGLMIFLTELTSNTASTATLIPVMYLVALGIGADPYLLCVPAAMAASCAFMLPVATPPNAIVFGSGRVTVAQMSRAGFALNLLGIVVITGVTYAILVPVLGISLS